MFQDIYPITNMSSINNIDNFLTTTNSNGGGWLYTGLDIMLFFIMFLSMINFGLEVSFLTSAFISLIIGMFLAYLGLVAWWFVGVWFGLILVIFVYIIWNNKYD